MPADLHTSRRRKRRPGGPKFWSIGPIVPVDQFSDATLADGRLAREVDLNDLVTIEEFGEERLPQAFLYNAGYMTPPTFLVAASKADEEHRLPALLARRPDSERTAITSPATCPMASATGTQESAVGWTGRQDDDREPSSRSQYSEVQSGSASSGCVPVHARQNRGTIGLRSAGANLAVSDRPELEAGRGSTKSGPTRSRSTVLSKRPDAIVHLDLYSQGDAESRSGSVGCLQPQVRDVV